MRSSSTSPSRRSRVWGTVAIGIPLMLACASSATAARPARAVAVPARRVGSRQGISRRSGLRDRADNGRLSLDRRREGAGAFRRTDVQALSAVRQLAGHGTDGARHRRRRRWQPLGPAAGACARALSPARLRARERLQRPPGVGHLGDDQWRGWRRPPRAARSGRRRASPRTLRGDHRRRRACELVRPRDGAVARRRDLARDPRRRARSCARRRRHAGDRGASGPEGQLPAGRTGRPAAHRHGPRRRAMDRRRRHDRWCACGAREHSGAGHDSRSRVERVDCRRAARPAAPVGRARVRTRRSGSPPRADGGCRVRGSRRQHLVRHLARDWTPARDRLHHVHRRARAAVRRHRPGVRRRCRSNLVRRCRRPLSTRRHPRRANRGRRSRR